MGCYTDTYRIAPSRPEPSRVGNLIFHKIGGYTVREARGRTGTIRTVLYTPVKQVKSGGYIKQVGQRAYMHKTALKTARSTHAHHPARTPVNGNFMIIVGKAGAETEGQPYQGKLFTLENNSREGNPHAPMQRVEEVHAQKVQAPMQMNGGYSASTPERRLKKLF